MKRIFLMGYMGAGKTTVGKKLSKQLNLSFIDLDYYIEGRYHKEIRQLFAERGEDAFRDIERRMLHEVASFEMYWYRPVVELLASSTTWSL